jgi:hypothetical protein
VCVLHIELTFRNLKQLFTTDSARTPFRESGMLKHVSYALQFGTSSYFGSLDKAGQVELEGDIKLSIQCLRALANMCYEDGMYMRYL